MPLPEYNSTQAAVDKMRPKQGVCASNPNRIRFVIECLEAMIAVAGDSAKVAIKISPAMPFNDIHDADPKETYTTFVAALAPMRLGYLHVLRTALPETFDLLKLLYPGAFAVGGGFTKATGDEALQSGLAGFDVSAYMVSRQNQLPML